MLDQMTIERITNWANGNATNDYGNKYFGPLFTDKLRRELRSLAIDKPDEVRGSWREGYEIALSDGAIIGVGTVTKGNNLFCIYYRPPRQPYQPATADMVASWRRS